MKGFSTLMLLFLLPLILVIITVTITSFYWITAYTQKQKLCRHTLLSAQKILADGINQLIALNPQAKALRFKEKLIKMAIVSAAGNPPLLAELIAQLKLNHYQQTILHLKMTTLEKNAEIKSQAILFESAKHFLILPRAKLHLTKYPPRAIAPDFLPKPHFELKQRLSLSWQTQFNSFLNFFMHTKNIIDGNCSTTLIRKETQWHATLRTN